MVACPGHSLLLLTRARGEIDLPPFGSADEFRQALVRFLSRPGPHVIAAAMARWRPVPAAAPPAARAPERRVAGPRVDELRRMLRDADLERIALAERVRQQQATVRRAAPAAPARAPCRRAQPAARTRDMRGALIAAIAATSLAAGGLFWTSRGTTAGSSAAQPAASQVVSRSRVARGDAGAAHLPAADVKAPRPFPRESSAPPAAPVRSEEDGARVSPDDGRLALASENPAPAPERPTVIRPRARQVQRRCGGSRAAERVFPGRAVTAAEAGRASRAAHASWLRHRPRIRLRSARTERASSSTRKTAPAVA